MTRKFKGKISLLRGQAPAKWKREEANGKSQKCIATIYLADLDASVGQLRDMSYPPSHKSKS